MTSGQGDRKDRLAQALRDNLRRRKAQARAGSEPVEVRGDADAVRPDSPDKAD